uniref:ATP-dependent DNA helicase n=1 Tax=Lactuca sativa TaxID=4236 RepID=A0A9R1VKV8_LACSA|nr:hypothetical protein LSAT_V11C500231580 [Lactuca sativa]
MSRESHPIHGYPMFKVNWVKTFYPGEVVESLEDTLRSSIPSRSLHDFDLPMPSSDILAVTDNRLLLEEMTYNKEELQKVVAQFLPRLNAQPMSIYQTIVGSIEDEKQVLMFVYGHGGIGKTILWSTILSYFRSIGKVVLAVAASGIASLLLPSGTTAHSRFKIPIDLTKKSCDIKKRTILGDLMCHTSLIVWDEAPMSDRRCFEFLDRSLRDVLECKENPFGGISVLLGGDFRQTLPVVLKSTRSETIALTLPKSYLWPLFQVRMLTGNMRLLSNTDAETHTLSTADFATWLLNIGDGLVGCPDTDDPNNTSWVQIPDSLLIPPGPNAL